jgi:hypothetical protein
VRIVAKKPTEPVEPVTPAKSWNEMLLELIKSFVKFANQQKKAKITRS